MVIKFYHIFQIPFPNKVEDTFDYLHSIVLHKKEISSDFLRILEKLNVKEVEDSSTAKENSNNNEQD